MIKLFPHQQRALEETEDKNKVAYYLDMGLGKTFVGAEKMKQLGAKVNLVICQKSKIDDWIEHFKEHYPLYSVHDLTINKDDVIIFMELVQGLSGTFIGVINYELAFRRPELVELEDFTLMLDESSLIQNENSKRSRFILKKLHPENVILLSGTPTGGKYERLWSQLSLLGWKISKKLFYKQYVDFHYDDNEGFPIMVIDGYKNVERLKQKMRDHGCIFMKTEEVIDLPEQMHNTIKILTTKEYRKFRKDCIVTVDEVELVGDTTLTKMLYERQLCGQYNKDKLAAFKDLVESTNDRLVVFHNFTAERAKLASIAHLECGRTVGFVNGDTKDGIDVFNGHDDCVLFVQYQAGAMGLNLQKANKIVYFTPPLGSEIFEQSKKRIHRVGQDKPCFYYYLTCKGSIEEKIYKTLAMRKDYTDKLFEEDQ